MAKGEKIDYATIAAARLAGQPVEGQLGVAKEVPGAEQEDDYLQPGKRRAEPEEGWSHKGQNKDKAFFAKTASQSRPESREALNFPSAEQCEILKKHQNYIWFKEGTKLHFLDRTKDSGMSEAERLAIFEQNCEEDLVSDIQLIIEDGGLADWEEFVVQKTRKTEGTYPQQPTELLAEPQDAQSQTREFYEAGLQQEPSAFEAPEISEQQIQEVADMVISVATRPDSTVEEVQAAIEASLMEVKKYHLPTGATEKISALEFSQTKEVKEKIDQAWDLHFQIHGEGRIDTADYFDRDKMRPLLERFYKLNKKEQEKSGVDINMLFYFLEGTGKVDIKFPVNIDGREVGKKQYLSEVKKLKAFTHSLKE